MKKFGDGQQPFHAIIDIPEGDSQELTTVTDQALNSFYGELFNLLQTHGINPTATTNADLKQVARAVWAAATTGTLFIDTGTANNKILTHVKGASYLYKNGVSNDGGFTVRFVNKVANTGAVTINVLDIENNQNHFNLTPLVNADGSEIKANNMLAGAMVEAYYDVATNKFIVISIGNTAAFSSHVDGLGDALIAVKQPFEFAVARTQHEKNADYVTPLDFGAIGDGVADDSVALATALKFGSTTKAPIDGLGKSYACHNVLFDSNLIFKNANLISNKFNEDLVSVISSGESQNWIENVYFENIKIDGKRSLHTGIKATTTAEDGGRHGFRFVRKCRNIKLVNCEAVNCASDGIIFYAKTAATNSRVNNVVLIDCNFSGNRRHGGSADTVDGFYMQRVRCTGNGLDIDQNAAADSGLRGDKFNGKLYGNGFDFEEYGQDLISTNIYLDNCIMTGNARNGLLGYSHGNTSENTPKSVVIIKKGSYDKGLFNYNNHAIIFRQAAYITSPIKNIAMLYVDGVNFNGGDIATAYALNFTTSNLINLGRIAVLENTIAYTDAKKDKIYKALDSFVYTNINAPLGEIIYDNGVLNFDNSTNKVELRSNITSSGLVKFSVFNSTERGGIKMRLNGDGFADVVFYGYNDTDYLIASTKKLRPTATGYNLGDAAMPFNTIYLTTAPVVASDSRLKTDVRQLNEKEKMVASALAKEICIYKMQGEKRNSIGVIAQKVVSIFEKNGLNALDYNIVHYSEEADRYGVSYEQLILFIFANDKAVQNA